MYQPRVSYTEKINGNIVAPVKLVAIEQNTDFIQFPCLRTNMSYQGLSVAKSLTRGPVKYFRPILISEKEKLQVGDYHVNMHSAPHARTIQRYTKERHLINARKDWRFKYQRKILALPDSFTVEQLDAIVHIHLIESEMYLKCDQAYHGTASDQQLYNYNFVYLDEMEQITIFPKDSELGKSTTIKAVEDYIEFCKKQWKGGRTGISLEQIKKDWIKANNY